MTQLKMLSADDKLTEIRRLYFNAGKQSIQQDLTKALDLLKSMSTEEERERAAVYMEGLAEMRNDWLRQRSSPQSGKGGGGKGTKAAAQGAAKSVGKSAPKTRPKGATKRAKKSAPGTPGKR